MAYIYVRARGVVKVVELTSAVHDGNGRHNGVADKTYGITGMQIGIAIPEQHLGHGKRSASPRKTLFEVAK